jgi:N-acylneuraminate cytidylyltransferase
LKNFAIIPARGGSKRIPRKNIRVFQNRPIIQFAIDAAADSGLFEKIIVSTDDEETASISRDGGAEVLNLRPPSLSDDFVTTQEVITYEIGLLNSYPLDKTFVCCIYPTSPFLRSEYLIQALELLKSSNFDFVFSATENSIPIQRSFRKKNTLDIELLFPEFSNSRTQDLFPTYHDAGQFYWGSARSWLENESVLNSKSSFIEIPSELSIDIDNESDWIRAELLFKELQNRELL